MPITTYHCLCTEPVLATGNSLTHLSVRNVDKAHILAISPSDQAVQSNSGALTPSVEIDNQPMVLKFDDGFEKRYLARCSRCGLMLGYQLDLSQFESTQSKLGPKRDVLYILPEGLLTTEEMSDGKREGDTGVGE